VAALAPLLAIATIRTPRRRFSGLGVGTVFFLVLLRWLQYTFQSTARSRGRSSMGPSSCSPPTAGSGRSGGVAVSWLTARRSAALALGWRVSLGGRRVAARPLFGGFPWGALGYSQYLHLRVIQIAELAGVHAVSFVLLA